MPKFSLKFSMLYFLAATLIPSLAYSSSKTEVQGTAPAYYIAEFIVHDMDSIKPYSAEVPSTLEPFKGVFTVRRGKITSLEGSTVEGGIVVIEFPSMQQAVDWYNSEAYAKLKPIRHRSATTRAYIVEGLK